MYMLEYVCVSETAQYFWFVYDTCMRAPLNRNKNSRIPKLIHTKTNGACHCRYEHRPEYLVNESSINNFLEPGTRE